MEKCSVVGCEYHSGSECLCCDDCHDPEKGSECMSYIDKDEPFYVYLVMKIKDYEYGCREVDGVFSTEEKALQYIKSIGNKKIKFWNDSKAMLYTVVAKEVK